MLKRNELKIGRYEKNNLYVEFKPISETEILYTWGVTGFNSNESRLMCLKEASDTIKELTTSGFIHVDEIPVSEKTDADMEGFLDWVGGITR